MRVATRATLLVITPLALAACSSGGGIAEQPLGTTGTLLTGASETNAKAVSYTISGGGTKPVVVTAVPAGSDSKIDLAFTKAPDGTPSSAKLAIRDLSGTTLDESLRAPTAEELASFNSNGTTKLNVLYPSKNSLYGSGTVSYTASTRNGTVEVFDPAKLGGFSYATLGDWAVLQISGSYLSGVAPIGIVTKASEIPTTGSATYSGVALGNYAAPSANQFARTRADATAIVDFASQAGTFTTTNTVVQTALDTASIKLNNNLDMTGQFSLTPGANKIATTALATRNAGAMTGSATGQFYGPGGAEMGGSYSVTGAGGTMVGGFLLKK